MTKELTLHDMYVEHLKDMYSAENQILKALPKIVQKVTSPELRMTLETHLKETEGQVARLEQIFQSLEANPRGKKCMGMEGILEEGKEAMELKVASPDLMDSALIGGCQKVEHYEICGYSELIHMAELLGDRIAVGLLKTSLQQEEIADQKLAKLNVNMITPQAIQAAQVM